MHRFVRRTVTALSVVAGMALLALATPGPLAALARPLEVYFIDVEGGAATLTVLPSGESILVDTGWPGNGGRDAKRIEHAARYVAGLDAIDHLVCTHWHTDHYGGTEELAKRIPIRNYWDRGIPEQASDGARDFPTLMALYKQASAGKSKTLRVGDRLPLRPSRVPTSILTVSASGRVLGDTATPKPSTCTAHPPTPVKDESDNMQSIGLLLKHGRFDFLNLADLTWDLEHRLVCPKNRIGQVDLWQVSHHGANQSNNPALIEAIAPRVAVMANGARKGGAASTVKTLKNTPSLEALYQLHLNVTTGVDDNAPHTHIANLHERCNGEFIRVRVSEDASRYTVYKGANLPLQTFAVR